MKAFEPLSKFARFETDKRVTLAKTEKRIIPT